MHTNLVGKKLVIVRTLGSIINFDTYNCQEVGLAKVLVDKGMDVVLIFAGRDLTEHTIQTARNNKVHIYYVPFIGIKPMLSFFIGLNKILKNLKPDIVQIHEFNSTMSYMTLKWSKLNNVKCVLIQGPYSFKHKDYFSRIVELFFNRAIGPYILRNIDAIGCKTKMAVRYLVANGANPDLLSLTKIGLDIERFKNYEKIDWRSRLNIRSDHKILLYIGILEKRRNVDFLIKLLKGLDDDVCLVVVGNGPEDIILRNLAETLGVGKRCFFTGSIPQHELPSLYESCDLFLLPSSYEIYGMVILEAMYFALPIISSLTGGSETIIKDSINGILITNFNEEDWLKAINELMTNKMMYLEIKSRQREYILDNFLWEVTANDFIELYNDM